MLLQNSRPTFQEDSIWKAIKTKTRMPNMFKELGPLSWITETWQDQSMLHERMRCNHLQLMDVEKQHKVDKELYQMKKAFPRTGIVF